MALLRPSGIKQHKPYISTVQYPLSVLVLVHAAKMAESPSLRNFDPVFNVLEHLF